MNKIKRLALFVVINAFLHANTSVSLMIFPQNIENTLNEFTVVYQSTSATRLTFNTCRTHMRCRSFECARF